MKVVYIIAQDVYFPSSERTVTSYYVRTTPFSAYYSDVKHRAAKFQTKAEAEAFIPELRQDTNVTYSAITYVEELPEIATAITPKEAEAIYFELGAEFTADESKYYAAELYEVHEFDTLAEREAFIMNRREQLPADTNGYPG